MKMQMLMAGASGLIGSTVAQYLEAEGHEVVRLVRQVPGKGEILSDPGACTIGGPGLEGIDCGVHLARLPWSTRWTSEFKEQIRAKRLGTDRLLAEPSAGRARKRPVLVCASGMGIYPPLGDQIITEDSPVGTSFLANLERDGQAATSPASTIGIRVVHRRIPPVLHAAPIRRGTSRIGDGCQWMSWVGLDEMAGIVYHVLVTEGLSGPVNTVSPKRVRNTDFAAPTSQVLGQKPGLPMPAFLVHLLRGKTADIFAIASRRIKPRRLFATDCKFKFPDLQGAMRHELKPARQLAPVGRHQYPVAC
jgi:uncharacterized protein (TIGR01777 family)